MIDPIEKFLEKVKTEPAYEGRATLITLVRIYREVSMFLAEIEQTIDIIDDGTISACFNQARNAEEMARNIVEKMGAGI